ncbi:hypothetical protein ISF6_3374 [Piscinibacter sakaiensis]|uniref:Uncharacterized protein n=1 Tax=Piscinibacter sakaiensis TaxID=1547922 RepID=A0A0K8P4R1_PISS1|nr:hypothetical protein ISF6_3374 [Piscinibacter sakaiensis]
MAGNGGRHGQREGPAARPAYGPRCSPSRGRGAPRGPTGTRHSAIESP